MLAACASIDPQPFADFSSSVSEVRTGADSVLQYNAEQTRDALIEQIVRDAEAGDVAALNSLKIGINELEPFELPRDQTPDFLEGRWFRSGIRALNTSLVDYTLLLQQLAQPALIPPEQFDHLARDLNANVQSALRSLGQEPDARQVGLFATTATALTRGFLEWQRRKALLEAIEENQTPLTHVVAHARGAVEIAAAELAENYRANAQATLRTVATQPKRSVAQAMIQLDEEYVARLELLKTLDDAYAALPKAHRELLSAVKDPGLDLQSIDALYVEGKRLHKLYAELAGATSAEP